MHWLWLSIWSLPQCIKLLLFALCLQYLFTHRDFHKFTKDALAGIPPSGAEDSTVKDLRGELFSSRRNLVDTFYFAMLWSPRAALLGARVWGGRTLDVKMFGEDEAALKSPFSWEKALLCPGVVAAQYQWHFVDTDPFLGLLGILNFLAVDLFFFYSAYKLVRMICRRVAHLSLQTAAHIIGNACMDFAESALFVLTFFFSLCISSCILNPVISILKGLDGVLQVIHPAFQPLTSAVYMLDYMFQYFVALLCLCYSLHWLFQILRLHGLLIFCVRRLQVGDTNTRAHHSALAPWGKLWALPRVPGGRMRRGSIPKGKAVT
jgi:hypothetical protein